MSIEIERKFLVCGDFKQYAYKSERISQGYLSTNSECTVRIRQNGGNAFITIKGKSNDNGLSRFEWEKEIEVSEAEQLLQLCDLDTIIDKTRYYIKSSENLVFEVDEFHALNEGLIVAEIELEHINQDFNKPEWLGQEVTGDIKYYNSQLSKNPYNKWTHSDDRH